MKITITENIPAGAYAGREDITEIEIAADVCHLGDRAFMGCKNLKNITSHAHDTHIGYECFKSCIKLEKATFKVNMHLSENAFEGCRRLSYVTGKTQEIPAECFKNCIRLISIPDAYIYRHNAFENTGIVELSVDEDSKLRNMEHECFKDCKQLRRVSLKKRVSIGDSCFEANKSLEFVNLSSVTHIGECVFMYCKNIKTIIWSKYVSKVPFAAFSECKNLSNVMGTEAIAVLGDFAFFQTKLKESDFPGINNIPANTFKWTDEYYAHRVDDTNRYI